MNEYLMIFLGETLGTMVLILLGNGVVANVLYKRTGGSKGGIISIAFG
jgi:glycerol uptake facilitator protein